MIRIAVKRALCWKPWNGLARGPNNPPPGRSASPACRRFHDLAVEMPGRMRENGNHDRETGEHQ